MAIVLFSQGKASPGDMLVTDPQSDKPYIPCWAMVPISDRPDTDATSISTGEESDPSVSRLLLWAVIGFGVVILFENLREVIQSGF